MIPEFFDDEKKFAILLRELKSWEGTKFSKRSICIKGTGTDCIRFVIAVLHNCGAVPPIDWPKYVVRGGGRQMRDLLITHLDAVPTLSRIWTKGSDAPAPLPKRGRLIVMSGVKDTEEIYHTALIATPPTIWHCWDGVGEGSYFDSSCRDNLFAVYRVNATV